MENFKVRVVNGIVCESQEAYDKLVSRLKYDGLYFQSGYEDKTQIDENWVDGYTMSKINGSCGC